MKRIRAIALVLVCLLLVGCGRQSSENAGGSESAGKGGGEKPAATEGVTVGARDGGFYSAAAIDIPGDPSGIIAALAPDGYVYLCCLKVDTSVIPYINAGQWVSRLDLNNNSVTELWQDPDSSAAVSSMAVDSEGSIWLLKSRIDYDAAAAIGRESVVMTLIRLSADGSEHQSWSLDFIDRESDTSMYPGGMFFAEDGSLYIPFDTSGQKKLVGLEVKSGEISSESVASAIDAGDYGDGFIGLYGAEALLFGSDPDGSFIRSVNIRTGQKGEKQRVDTRIGAAYMGAGEFNALVDDGSNLYSLDPETGTLTKILNWVSCGYAGGPRLISLPDGSFLALSFSGGSFMEMKCEMLVKSESEAPAVTLTIATAMPYGGVADAAVRFNREHDDTKIEVLDYSVYNTGGDYSAGAMRMAVEIIAGKTPDIFYLDGLPAASYASRGLLENLYPFIDADSELDRSDFHENILEAFEIGGCLYELPLRFTIDTMAGRSDVVGKEAGWSFEEFTALVEKTGAEKPFGAAERGWFLEGMVRLYGDLFVDWGAGDCDFDNELFRNLLRLSAMQPDSPTVIANESDYQEMENALWNGGQLLAPAYIYSYDSIPQIRAQFRNEDISFKGFPGAPGNGSAVSAVQSYAISSASGSKEAAWRFLSWLIEADSRLDTYYNSLPITKAGLDNMLDRETAEDFELIEGGEATHAFYVGIMVDVPYEPESNEALIRELIESQTRAARNDDKLLAIISEEAGAFFAGDKSVEETARIIQSRASIYVAEQS